MATRPSRNNEAISDVVADWLATHPVSGTALIVDDRVGRIATELQDFGVEVTPWDRLGASGSTWLPEGRWDTVIARLPKGKDALEMYLHGSAARLQPNGTLLLCGANDEGVRSASKRMAEVFEDVSTVETRRRCRIVRGLLPTSTPRGDLDAWSRPCSDGDLSWVSFPGLFAHGRLDAGSRELLRWLQPDPGTRVLDFGCGAGVLALALQNRVPGLSVDLLDVDGLAVEAARRNLPDCRVIHSDGWKEVRGERWDLIVSNPPFHDGVARDHAVLDRLVREAPAHLSHGGTLALVCQRNVPVMERLKETFGARRCERLHLGKFQVWRATNRAERT